MKELRFSTFAQVLTVLLCAAMIWVGLYVLDSRANVVWDLTPDLLTELSEGTIQTMDGLDAGNAGRQLCTHGTCGDGHH